MTPRRTLNAALLTASLLAAPVVAGTTVVDSCGGCAKKPYVIRTADDDRLKMESIVLERRLQSDNRTRSVGVAGYDRVVMEDDRQIVDTFCAPADEVRIRLPRLSDWQREHGFSITATTDGALEQRVLGLEQDAEGAYFRITRDELAALPEDGNGYHVLRTNTAVMLLDENGRICQSVKLPYDAVLSDSCAPGEGPRRTQDAPTQELQAPATPRIRVRGPGARAPSQVPAQDVPAYARSIVPGQLPVPARSTPAPSAAPYTFPQCADGVDNDGDGLIDYPQDKTCDSPGDDSEGKRRKADAPSRSAATPIRPRANAPRAGSDVLTIAGRAGTAQFSSTTGGDREAIAYDTQGVTARYEHRAENWAAVAAVTGTTGSTGETAFGTPVGETIDATAIQGRLEGALRIGDSPFALNLGLGVDYLDINTGFRQGYQRFTTGRQNDLTPAIEAGPMLGRFDESHIAAGYGAALQSVHETFLNGEQYESGASTELTPYWFLKGRLQGEKLYGDLRAQYMPDNRTLFTNGLHELESRSESYVFRLEIGGDFGQPGHFGWAAALSKELGRERLFDLPLGQTHRITTDIDSVMGGITYRIPNKKD